MKKVMTTRSLLAAWLGLASVGMMPLTQHTAFAQNRTERDGSIEISSRTSKGSEESRRTRSARSRHGQCDSRYERVYRRASDGTLTRRGNVEPVGSESGSTRNAGTLMLSAENRFLYAVIPEATNITVFEVNGNPHSLFSRLYRPAINR